MDLLRPGVNSRVRQAERFALPRLLDAAQDALHLMRSSPGQPGFIVGTDVADAFHQVPLRPDEWRFVCASVLGHYYVFTVVIFGAASAPTTWGRFGAFLGRSTAALLDPDLVRQDIYVDDPIFVASGPRPRVIHQLALAMLWGSALGYPFAWAKCDGGNHVVWIGAQIHISIIYMPLIFLRGIIV